MPVTMEGRTGYAPARGGALAYQVHGEGPFDVVLVGGFPQHIEVAAEQPGYRRLSGATPSER